MAITINPLASVTPVTATSGATADAVLQPGTTVNAQVLQQLGDNTVRIAIANLALDVLTEVPLTAGQSLQLAVGQTADGLRLQIVPQTATGNASSLSQSAATTISLSQVASSALTLDNAVIGAPANATTPVLTAAQAAAVTAAVQAAAGQQDSSSPLFANASVAATTETFPPVLQQAAAQLLAVRPALDGSLSGDDVQAAFRGSGLFLEQSLAVNGVSSSSVAAQSGPDLKAALIVFRQTVNSWLGEQGGAATTPASASINAVGNPLLATALRAAAANQGLTSLQEVLAAFPKGVRDAVQNLLADETSPLIADKVQLAPSSAKIDTSNLRDIPPPPFRGAAPSAQPPANASIDGQTSAHDAARTLRNDADAAIARQTLLQIASLPQQTDAQAPRNDLNGPRWNFEIPFVTPQGTAVAQFEISREGNGAEKASAQKVWRARFSLDVEPAGPVHALVSLSGERTSVRIWAERPLTAAQLRADVPQLDHALREAALEPGDIVIGDGAPPQPAKAAAGHFLDRAS